MKTIDGREIPMWEAPSTAPVQCVYCKNQTTRCYIFKRDMKQPWVPLCDEHRRPEAVDYLYLHAKNEVPGYDPSSSLLCNNIFVLPVVEGTKWTTHCPHRELDQSEVSLGDRLAGIKCPRCDVIFMDEEHFNCHGCRMSSLCLLDRTDNREIHMPEWVWDRYIAPNPVLAKKQSDNLYFAEFNMVDSEASHPMIVFTLSEGGKVYAGPFEIGVDLIKKLLHKPIPRFDLQGNPMDPWVYNLEMSHKFSSMSVHMAYMSEENTSSGVMTFDIDSLGLSKEQAAQMAEALRKAQAPIITNFRGPDL